MKKFLTFTAIILVLLGAAGYAVWHFGTNIASEKIIEKVESTLDDENLEEVKSYIENDSKVQEIVSEAATINPDTLPFQTKEEATRVLIKKWALIVYLIFSNKRKTVQLVRMKYYPKLKINCLKMKFLL